MRTAVALLWLAVPFLATGCIQLGGEALEMRRHAIDAVPSAARAPNGPVLAVRAFEVLSRFERRIVRRRSDGSFGYLELERWVDDPADAVRVALRERLMATGRFRAVVDASAAFESDLVLEGSLLDCELVETEAGGPGARLTLRLALAETISGRVVHDGAHEAIVPLAPDPAASGEADGPATAGLGAAMTDAVDQVARAAVAAWSAAGGGGILPARPADSPALPTPTKDTK